MANKWENANDVVYAVAKRARELANEKMDSLRYIAGYNCDTNNEAQQMNKGLSRGELIELILTEEFTEDSPLLFE